MNVLGKNTLIPFKKGMINLTSENNNKNQDTSLRNNMSSNPLFGIAVSGILLTTIYTAILASQLMATKNKVNYLYYKEKFDGQKN